MLNTESSKTELRTKKNTQEKPANHPHSQVRPHTQHQANSTIRHRTLREAGQLVTRSDRAMPHSVGRVAESVAVGTADLPFDELALGHFRNVAWPEVNLSGCDAHGADFRAAILTDLCALGGNFANAQFMGAQLSNAALCGANLMKADLRAANLRNANLSWCNLRGAMLAAADLCGANLAWADLREVDLHQTDLVGAYYNSHTQWPVGFDPVQARLIHLAESR